jgi:hypothetical protein
MTTTQPNPTTINWDTLTDPRQQIERDSYGRPLIYPTPGATKKIAYTRCTTYVDATEDKWRLSLWSQRMVALGLAARPDYLLAVTTADGDKQKLDDICEQAKEFAQATAAATIGTALHALTERLDRGEELPFLNPPYAADIAAYKHVMAPLKIVHREAFTVLDKLKVGGTPDGIAEYRGERFIFDIKTGDIQWAISKIARQLALYSRSELYNHDTGERTPHGASTKRGLIVHLPAATGTAKLVWVDLLKGWHGVQLCTAVREHRTLNTADLAREGLDADPFPDPTVMNPMPVDNLMSAISGASSRDHLVDIWRKNQDRWGPGHQTAVEARLQWLDTHRP